MRAVSATIPSRTGARTALRLLLLLPALTVAAAPSAQAAAKPAQPCTLENGQSEFSACVVIDAALSKAPVVGQAAKLTVHIRGASPDHALVTIDLPAGLSFAAAPSGFSIVAPPPNDGSIGARAQGTVTLPAGQQPRTLRATLHADTPGAGDVSVTAVPTKLGGTANASVPLTVGTNAAGSKLGVDVPVDAPPEPTTGTSTPDSPWPYHRAPPDVGGGPGAARVHLGNPAPDATTCVDGTWNFLDQNGVLRPSVNVTVSAWDQNGFPDSDSLLALTGTNGSGAYSMCFSNAETGSVGSGTADLFLRFRAENTRWNVRADGFPNTTYQWRTDTIQDVGAGTIHFGGMQPALAWQNRALHAFDEINDAFGSLPNIGGKHCWDEVGTCEQKEINWDPGSSGTFTGLDGVVHILPVDPDFPPAPIHELGHAVMWDVDSHTFPPGSGGSHSLGAAINPGMAWAEGWAEAFQMHVLPTDGIGAAGAAEATRDGATWGDPPTWSNCAPLISNPKLCLTEATGDTVESRVAWALEDLEDTTNEGPWDRVGEGFGSIWSTFQHHTDANFAAFWNDRTADGFDVGTSALATLYENTIDYGFVDDLPRSVATLRPTPPNQAPIPPGSSNTHRFSYLGNGVTWQAVAIKPPASAAYRLGLFTDETFSSAILQTPDVPGATVPFIAYDNSLSGPGQPSCFRSKQYPRVSQSTGTGTYTIEWAQDGAVAPDPGTVTFAFSAADIVDVRTVQLAAGQVLHLDLNGPGSADPVLSVMARSVPTTCAYLDTQAAMRSDNPPGADEALTFVAPATATYGIVTTQKSGNGTYHLTIS